MSGTPRSLDRVRRMIRETGDEMLGELAVAHGFITPAQLEDALRESEVTPQDPVACLVARGLLSREQISELRRLRDRRELETLIPGAAGPVPEEVVQARLDPQRIVDRYVLIEPVGRGGAGTVWKAWDAQLHRWVACKLPGRVVSDEFRQRFIREARIAAGLHHPNLVAVHDAGEFQGQLYLVMEFVHGRPVDASGGPRRAAEMLRKVALALQEAHQHGVVHRDLKPDNVLIDERDEPRVVDFGLARVEGVDRRLTRTGVLVGTPMYMAPEQVRAEVGRVGPLTDVYALGAILYELLAGRPPYLGRTAPEVFEKIVRDDPVPPTKLNARVPADLETVCLKAMSKEPGDRYRTAGELAADLGRFLAGEPILARRTGVMTRVRARLRKHAWGWILGAAAAAIAVAALVTVISMIGRQRVQRLVDQAERDYARGRIEGAERLIAEAMRIAPDDREVAGLHARLLLRRYQCSRGAPEARLIEQTLLVQASRPESDDEKRLREEIRRTLQRHPDNPVVEGALLIADGRCDEALARLEAAGEGGPAGSEAGFYAGLALYLKRDVVAAAGKLQRYPTTDAPLVCPVLARVLLARGLWARSCGETPRVWFQKALGMAEDLEQTGEMERGVRLAAEVLVAMGDWNAQQGVAVPDMLDGAIGQYEAALRKLGGRVDLAKGDALAGIAYVHYQRGDGSPARFDEAVRAYDEVIAQSPAFAAAYVRRSAARRWRYHLHAKFGRPALEDMEHARDDLRRALELVPDLCEAAMQVAMAESLLAQARARGDPNETLHALEQCVEEFRQIVKRWPRYPLAHGSLAHARVVLGVYRQGLGQDPTADYEAAIADLERVGALGGVHPHSALGNARHNLIQARLRQGRDVSEADFKAAVDDWSRAVELNPLNADGWSERGSVYLTLTTYRLERGGDWKAAADQAMKDFAKALAVDANFCEAHVRRGILHQRLGDGRRLRGQDAAPEYEAAIQDFKAALRINAGEPDAWSRIGVVQAGLGIARGNDRPLLDEALATLTEAMRYVPCSSHLLIVRAQVLEILGRRAEAIKDLEDARRLDPAVEEDVRKLLDRFRRDE